MTIWVIYFSNGYSIRGDLPQNYDIIIFGGRSAGLFIASRLQRAKYATDNNTLFSGISLAF
jgi:hypothetical protein